MRSSSLFAPSLFWLAACAAPTGPATQRDPVAVAEAGWTRSDAAAFAEALPDDAIQARLLQAARTVLEHRRRIALENLANVGSIGWKRRIALVSTQPLTTADGQQHVAPTVRGSALVFTPGPLEATGRALDVAIDGDGLFAVTCADGRTAYTRDGRWQVDASGKLRTGEGLVVLPEITLPSDALELVVDPQGHVRVRTAGSPDTDTLLGQLTLHRFVNPARLRSESSLWFPCEETGAPISGAPGLYGLGCLRQAMLERGNVDAAQELHELQACERQLRDLLVALRSFGTTAP